MEKNHTISESLMKTYGFTKSDFDQIEAKGIALKNIARECAILETGIVKILLDRPAKVNDGIQKISDSEFQEYSNFFDAKKEFIILEKFVPASGAATRMFKFLSEFLNNFDIEKDTINSYINRKKANNLSIFIVGLEKFPFYEIISDKLNNHFSDFNSWNRYKKIYFFIKFLMDSEQFNFANKPKAVLPFHKYHSHLATPIEEHINESIHYASSNNISNIHFTVTEEHQLQFEQIVNSIKNQFEINNTTKLNISYSYQNKSTNTIGFTLENKPFRNENGELMFRPGGHGALIENLQNLNADLVFIKNIDNIIQNSVQKIALYKKGLAGILIDLQEKIFEFLHAIEKNEINEMSIQEIINFIKIRLSITIAEDFYKYTLENKILHLKEILDRPIRVCGMVINEGEPGGGPFWIRDKNGFLSLQIVETSQIDLSNIEQSKIVLNATHFNPVDLVCGLKNYKNEKFILSKYIDHNSGFIVEKNIAGKTIKAYELPGLWNGAMANWITIFVEVPLLTFNPVKTVNDLLKPAHQPL